MLAFRALARVIVLLLWDREQYLFPYIIVHVFMYDLHAQRQFRCQVTVFDVFLNMSGDTISIRDSPCT